MKRREFVLGAGVLLAMPAAPLVAASSDDEAALKKAINDYYSIYYRDRNERKYHGTRNRRWLESAVLRRAGSGWLIGLLHSTRMGTPAA